jgi:hypothetical protein
MPLFGGNPGQYLVLPARPRPPVQIIRVIPGRLWWTLLHWPWRRYLAAVSTGVAGVPHRDWLRRQVEFT